MNDRSMQTGAAAAFDPLRPRLTRIAYRMLGSVADAEDIVQEAFIRWGAADRTAVQNPEAYLRRVVARLCLDHMKSARARRETYVGTWLPEPFLESGDDEADDITLPLMMALERLSPLERAAFLLHDVFDMAFAEVAEIIGRDEASCRQLASRARGHVKDARPRYALPDDQGFAIAQAFFTASRTGDMHNLQRMLTDDIAFHADGGGKRRAVFVPVFGIERVMMLYRKLAEVLAGMPIPEANYCYIDGLPGFVTTELDGQPQTTALEIRDGKIAGIYVVRNPDKLRHLERTLA